MLTMLSVGEEGERKGDQRSKSEDEAVGGRVVLSFLGNGMALLGGKTLPICLEAWEFLAINLKGQIKF